jgi:hypothetical protein
MKANQKTFFITGIVIILISLLGLGGSLKELLKILIGIFIIVMSYFLPGAKGFLGNRDSNAFKENITTKVTDTDAI